MCIRDSITDVFRHNVCPHTIEAILSHDTATHPAHQRHAAFTPAFRAPQWHGAMQTHFPPRPRKSAWYCDVADVIRQAILSHDTANHPAHQRHAAFTPACFALPSGTATRKRTFHQRRPSLLGWRPSLLGWRPWLLGWRPSLRLEAMALRLEAMALRLEAIDLRLEAIALHRL